MFVLFKWSKWYYSALYEKAFQVARVPIPSERITPGGGCHCVPESISQDRTSKPEESSAKISGCDGHREIFAPQTTVRCCNTHVSKLINVDTVATDATAAANFLWNRLDRRLAGVWTWSANPMWAKSRGQNFWLTRSIFMGIIVRGEFRLNR